MISVPLISIDPSAAAVNGSSPSIALEIIDLPEPEEPIRPTRSPSAMAKSTSETINLPLTAMFRP